MPTTVYCDSRSDEILTDYWRLRRGPLARARVARLPQLAEAPEVLKPLLSWERTDWTVVVDGQVRCAVEFSGHGYTGDNSFQRFARIYRAATLGIPVIYFTPFNRARLNEIDEGRISPRNVSPELFQTMLAMSERLGVPCLAVHWPTGTGGIPAPLQSPAVREPADTLVRLVHYFAQTVSPGSNRQLPADFGPTIEAMHDQAALPLRGSETRVRVDLPIDLASTDWVWAMLPEEYFGYGKADKVLAAAALRLVDRRRILGGGTPSWNRRGEAVVQYLGYQWRPDPASGLIALSAGQATVANAPLVVVWPRIFAAASRERDSMMSELRRFKQSGRGLLAEVGRELRFSPEAMAAFRDRVSVEENQFGVYQPSSKVGRILSEVAQAVILADAVITP